MTHEFHTDKNIIITEQAFIVYTLSAIPKAVCLCRTTKNHGLHWLFLRSFWIWNTSSFFIFLILLELVPVFLFMKHPLAAFKWLWLYNLAFSWFLEEESPVMVRKRMRFNLGLDDLWDNPLQNSALYLWQSP